MYHNNSVFVKFIELPNFIAKTKNAVRERMAFFLNM